VEGHRTAEAEGSLVVVEAGIRRVVVVVVDNLVGVVDMASPVAGVDMVSPLAADMGVDLEGAVGSIGPGEEELGHMADHNPEVGVVDSCREVGRRRVAEQVDNPAAGEGTGNRPGVEAVLDMEDSRLGEVGLLVVDSTQTFVSS
jgi:hypothetical protein